MYIYSIRIKLGYCTLKSVLVIPFILVSLFGGAQHKLDSLWGEWNKDSQTEENRKSTFHTLKYSDGAFDYLIAHQKTVLDKNRGELLFYLGNFYDAEDEVETGRGYFKQAISSFKATRLFSREAYVEVDLGRSYYASAIYDSALIHYFNAMDIYQAHDLIENQRGWLLHYIGSVYKRQGEKGKACEYYAKELVYASSYDYEDVLADAMYLNAYCEEDNTVALEMRLKSLELFTEQDNKSMMALLYDLIGASYGDFEEWEKSLEYRVKSYELRVELGNKEKIASSLQSLGSVYIKIGNYNKAIQLLSEAEAVAKLINKKRQLRLYDIYRTLSRANAKLYNFEEAFDYTKLAQLYEDSVQAITQSSEINELNVAFETAQKELEIEYLKKHEAIQEKELAQQMARVKIEKDLNQANNKLNIILIIGLLVVAVFTFIVLNRLKITRKQNVIIDNQKSEVELAHLKLGESNKEVMDSIKYAVRIQNALLKKPIDVNENIPEHFILYMPKDIVSGDFYWFKQEGDFIYIAVADCTGHGVPGAFLTVLGTSLLNEISSVPEVLLPSEIINELRDRLINELSQNDSFDSTADGMDISLARLNVKTNELDWAGANNPLYFFRGNELVEIKPDKEPVGYFKFDMTPFTNHKLQLKKEDVFFLITDGYHDQFGGDKGKKYKSVQLRNKIREISGLSMIEQKESLQLEFNNWKRDLEQIDDVCIIGVRI